MEEKNYKTNNDTKLAVIDTKLGYLSKQFDKFDEKISQSYISREDHAILESKVELIKQDVAALNRIKNLITIAVGTAVLAALLRIVIR